MKNAVRYACAFGLALSAPAMSRAWAQSVPPVSHAAFVLFEYNVQNPAAFKTFAEKVRATLKDASGQFVTREKVASPFGGASSNLSVISFPSVEDARKWLASPDLAKLRKERDEVADVRTYLVEKVE